MASLAAMHYLKCIPCGHKFEMTGRDYFYNFIIRECPKCHFIDTKNSMLPDELMKEKKDSLGRQGIVLEAVEY